MKMKLQPIFVVLFWFLYINRFECAGIFYTGHDGPRSNHFHRENYTLSQYIPKIVSTFMASPAKMEESQARQKKENEIHGWFIDHD